MQKTQENAGNQLVTKNQRALHRFEIEERIEGGLVLVGSEVKSLRRGRADLEGSFASFTNGECFLHNAFIAPYDQATMWGHEPKRTRKVLLHRSEIEKWMGRITMRGYTIVPLRLYFKGGRAKVELGLGKGKRVGDDREKMKKQIDLEEARAAIARARGIGGKRR